MRTTVGIDIGGTWMRSVAVDGEGRVSRRIREAAPDPAGRAAAIRRLLHRWRLRPDALVLGTHRVWAQSSRRSAEKELAGLARRVRVLADLEAAWLAAFAGRPGILVLSGTGSCAYGRDAKGRACRIGGLGPLLGDEGSSFWMGREWSRTLPMERRIELAHDPLIIRKTAALAKAVFASRRRPLARRIMMEAQRALVDQAEEAARRLRIPKPVPVSWHGGTFRDASFLEGFLKALSRSPVVWQPAPPRLAPEVAVALWGLRGERPGPLVADR